MRCYGYLVHCLSCHVEGVRVDLAIAAQGRQEQIKLDVYNMASVGHRQERGLTRKVVTQINFSNGPGLAQHTDTRKKHTHPQTTDCAAPVQMYVWKGTLFQQHNDDQEAIEIHTQTNLLMTVKNRNLRLDS